MNPQIVVCLTPGDVRQLIADVRALGALRAIRSQSATRRPESLSLESLSDPEGDWLTVFLVRDEDLAHVALREVPAKATWRVDSILSPVIEFVRPYFRRNEMRPGRLFYQSGYFDGDRARTKPEGFVIWAKKVFSLCRRRLKRDPTTDYYWGRTRRALVMRLSCGSSLANAHLCCAAMVTRLPTRNSETAQGHDLSLLQKPRGGGMERSATGNIPARVVKVREYKPKPPRPKS